MLMPKKVRYRKVQRGTMKGKAKGGCDVTFGEFGIQATEPHWLTAQQIEAMRITISRQLTKVGKLYLRVFPDKPITKKPAETRMGKGKGNPEGWVAVVKPGHIICEVAGLTEAEAREAFKQASYKLPRKMKFVRKAVVAQQ